MIFLMYILVGLVLGVIAKAIMKDSMGWAGTIIAGILGALLGGFIGNFLGKSGNAVGDLSNPWGWVLSVLGTMIVLAIWGAVSRGKATR